MNPLYWLRLLAYAAPDRAKRVQQLYDQCDEIVAILVSSIKTKRANMERNEPNAEVKSQKARASAKKKGATKAFFFEVPD